MDTASNEYDNTAESIPADLETVAAMLDRLASFDRAAMDDESEHRVASAALGALLQTDGAQQRVHRLAAMDRNAAPTLLEDRVFEASRQELEAPAHVAARSAIHAPAARESSRRGSLAIWTRRLAVAAAIALIGGAVAMILHARGGAESNSTQNRLASAANPASMSTIELKAALDRDMESLISALGESTSTQSSSAERQFDPEWIDDLLDGGKSS